MRSGRWQHLRQLLDHTGHLASYLAIAVAAIALAGLAVVLALDWGGHPLLAVLGSICALALVGVAVGLGIGRSRALLDVAARRAEIDTQKAELDTSRFEVTAAVLNERSRLARDLHDGIQSQLYGIILPLRSAARKTSDPAAAEAIDQAVAKVRQASAELRKLTGAMYPSDLEELGLEEAIRVQAERIELPVTLHLTSARLSPEMAKELYFLTGEAMTNIVKHARAHHATVDISISGGMIEVEIADDGVGGADPSGSGLAGLAVRVADLGGQLSISSPAGHGTKLNARIPCA